MTGLFYQLQPALGCVALCIASYSLLDAGVRIADRLLGRASLAVLCAGTAITATGLLVLLSLSLLFANQYHPFAALPGAVLIAGLARASCGQRPPGIVRALCDRLFQVARGYHLVLLLAVCGALLWSATRGLLLPPLSWDSLSYHLTIPVRWVQDGGYSAVPFPDALWDYGHYPNHGELITGWLLLFLHSDLLVNLGTLPFLVLVAVATFALTCELGGKAGDALLIALLILCSPPLFAFATTQYVDVQVTYEVLVALLFLVRLLRTGKAGDAILACAALGLAAGTKHTALVLAALGTVIVILVALRHRRTKVRRGAMLGIALMVCLSAPWYVRNWLSTGNPLYPFAIGISGHELWPGSSYQAAVIAQLKEASESNFLKGLLWHSPWGQPEDLALTFGPKLPLLALAGVLGLGILMRSGRRKVAVLFGAIVASEVLALAMPGAKPMRDHWPDLTHRFFTTSAALLACAATLLLAHLPLVLARAGRVLLFGLIVLDLTKINCSIGGHWLQAIGTASALALALALVPPWSRQRRSGWLITGAIAIAAVAMVPLQSFRDRTRYQSYMQARDVHDIPRKAVPGWERLDDPDRPLTIAAASGWDVPGHHWLLYPLFGRRLQNRVVYVPPSASGERGTYVQNLVEQAADGPIWLQRLHDKGVDVMFAVEPWPPELIWLAASASEGPPIRNVGYWIKELR